MYIFFIFCVYDILQLNLLFKKTSRAQIFKIEVCVIIHTFSKILIISMYIWIIFTFNIIQFNSTHFETQYRVRMIHSFNVRINVD